MCEAMKTHVGAMPGCGSKPASLPAALPWLYGQACPPLGFHAAQVAMKEPLPSWGHLELSQEEDTQTILTPELWTQRKTAGPP